MTKHYDLPLLKARFHHNCLWMKKWLARMDSNHE
jgi:hypothetical protein